MLFKQLIFGVLAIEQVSSLKLQGHEDLHSTAGTEWKLKDASEKIGNIKWTRPHEREVFDLGSILTDFYDQVGMKYGNQDFGTFEVHGTPYKYGVLPIDNDDYWRKEHPENREFYVNPEGPTRFVPRIPEVHYPAPKPYSYEVEYPSLSYREVEHIAPPKYESPKLRDLAEIETFPEGYTNEYDGYQIENYFGSDGSDHAHYLYDNIDDIDLNHGHFNPDPHAKVRPIQPQADHYFVPVVNAAPLLANYEDPYGDAVDPITLETYTDKFGIQRYLYNDKIAPGQAYVPDVPYQPEHVDYRIEYNDDFAEKDDYHINEAYRIEYDAVKSVPEPYEETRYYVVDDDHTAEAEEEYHALEEEATYHEDPTFIHHEPKKQDHRPQSEHRGHHSYGYGYNGQRASSGNDYYGNGYDQHHSGY